MNQPVVYLSKEFFTSFCKLLSERFDNMPVSKATLVYFETLLFERARVYINIEEQELATITALTPEDIKAIENLDTRILYGYIQIIDSTNKVKSCKKEIEIFRELKYDLFETMDKKPNFLFLADDDTFCGKIREEFGVVCVSKNLKFRESDTRVKLEIVADRIKIKPDVFIGSYMASHSVIIEDPHLFDNDKKGVFLESLLRTLFGERLQVKGTLTVICAKKDDIDIDAILSRIGRELNILTENYVRSSTFMHDRNIYSNSYWLSCDYGFKSHYTKPTKWIMFPLGLYFVEYQKRMKASIAFLKNENKLSVNNLIIH
jgi:hypothetical protein